MANRPTREKDGQSAYEQAVNAIVRATARFREATRATDDDDQGYVPNADENMPGFRVPLPAYCLDLAHKLWHETVAHDGCGLRMVMGKPPPEVIIEAIGGMAMDLPPEAMPDLLDKVHAVAASVLPDDDLSEDT